MRFRPRQRILRSDDFVRVMRSGKRLRHDAFNLLYQANVLGHARLGIAVGRRVSPRAVDRNVIKRVVRETFRHAADRLPPIDIVFLAQPSARTLGRHALAAAFAAALGRLAASGD